MIGKILAISDSYGEEFINQSEPEWNKHGFDVVSMDFKKVLKENNLEQYYLVIFIMGHDSNVLFQEYGMYIRSISSIPIIFFVHGKFKPDEEISLISTCADQVIDLPTSKELAVEKCLATIRRSFKTDNDNTVTTTLLIVGNVTLDIERYVVIVDNKEIKLLNKECHILKLLMADSDHVIPYDQIFCKVWSGEYVGSCKAVIWNQIKNLREKLHWHDGLPRYIITSKNIGYYFKSYENK